MSKWTEFRDAVEKDLSIGEVTEDVKRDFTNWCIETAMPLAKQAASSFVSQIQVQAKDEAGWSKARDLIVLPAIINGGLYLIEKVLTKTASATTA